MSFVRNLTSLFVALALFGGASAQPIDRFDSDTDWARFPKLFKPHGIRPERTVTVEPDGIWFDFDPLREARIAGMRGEISLRGNFEIEVKYELTEFPEKSTEGDGVMIGITVAGDSKYGLAAIKRGVHLGKGHQNRLIRGVPRPNGKMLYAISGIPTESHHGRLMLRRVGTEVIALSADTPDGELVEWKRYPFMDQPVRIVNLNADAGGSLASFRGRLYDLRIRTGASVPIEAGRPGPLPETITGLPADLPPQTVSATVKTLPGRPDVIDPTETDAPPSAVGRVIGFWWAFVLGAAVIFALGVIVGRNWLPKRASGVASAPSRSKRP